MKTLRAAFAAAVVVTSAIAPAASETPLGVAKTIEAKIRKAALTKDLSYFRNESTDDLVYILPNGKRMTKAQTMVMLEQRMKMTLKTKSYASKISSAKSAEGGVVFAYTAKMVSDVNLGKPKPSEMVSRSTVEILVVKQNGSWLTKRVKILKSDATVDGKRP
ncbi:MAG: hypothetical protein ACO1SV_13270 [Fimbriimonas sp.]